MINFRTSCLITSRKIILFTFLLLYFSVSYGQVSIRGNLCDTANNALSNAHVILFIQDIREAATISRQDGDFDFKKVKAGDYILSISCIGYESLVMNLKINKQNIDIGKIVMLKQDVELEETTVTGKTRIRKIDYEIIYPDEFQKKHSANGIDLVDKLALNNVKVDFYSNEIKRFDGSDIQLCLNGKSVSKKEIMALRPQEILRVEYYEHPKVRYSVPTINYITRKIESGGVISSELTATPYPEKSGTGMVALRLNRKKSEWGMIYHGTFSALKERYYNQQNFHLPDRSVQRDMKSDPTKYKQQSHDATLVYTYREENRTNFSITANHHIDHVPLWGKNYLWNTSGSNLTQNTLDSSKIKRNITSIEFYLEKQLKNQQSVIIDLTGTYFDDHTTNNISYLTNQKLTHFISSHSIGKKYSVFGVAGYMKNWEKGSLLAMLEHDWSSLDQRYEGTLTDSTDILQNTSKAGVRLVKVWGKWNVAVAGAFNLEQTKQKGGNTNRFTYQVLLSCMRQLGENSSVTYQGQLGRLSPSLYRIRDVGFQINDFLRQKGNPGLKANYFYDNSLSYNYSYKIFSANLQGFWYYEPHPVLKETRFEDPYFTQTYNNQKEKHQINVNLNLQAVFWQNHLSVSFCPTWNYTLNRSELYRHKHSFIYYFAEISGYYKNWILRTQIYNSFQFLEGEDLTRNWVHDDITLLYKYKNWMFAAGIANFLGRSYKNNQQENLSALTPEKSWSSTPKNKIYFRLSFNLPWGQQRQTLEQKIQTKDEGEGILK